MFVSHSGTWKFYSSFFLCRYDSTSVTLLSKQWNYLNWVLFCIWHIGNACAFPIGLSFIQYEDILVLKFLSWGSNLISHTNP